MVTLLEKLELNRRGLLCKFLPVHKTTPLHYFLPQERKYAQKMCNGKRYFWCVKNKRALKLTDRFVRVK